jgi:hypothetical protein
MSTTGLSQFFDSIFAAARAGLAASVLPPLGVFFQNTVKLDPLLSPGDAIAWVAQVDLLRSAVMANLTTALPAELIQLNQTFSNEIQAALTKWLTPPPPAPAPVAAAVHPAG